ncbi:hypothetical protein [Ideonella dechloratans]|uniref:hypothetical protein n=1 Tax=Ideonella dechloratans TaxID=36863 RepID=UPI0035B28CD0
MDDALDLGLATLARRFFASDRPGEAAIETAIAEVEDAIMPLRPVLPPEAWLVSTDAAVAAVAEQAGLSWQAGPATLDRDTVEALFHRWAALALGRPASQDALPIGGPGAGRFAATLLVLREWLHHLPQTALAVAPMAPFPLPLSPILCPQPESNHEHRTPRVHLPGPPAHRVHPARRRALLLHGLEPAPCLGQDGGLPARHRREPAAATQGHRDGLGPLAGR